jgi:hypothetical protein
MPETKGRMLESVKIGWVKLEPTIRGERLDITPVLGLSISNFRLRCGARCSDHESRLSCSAVILLKGTA